MTQAHHHHTKFRWTENLTCRFIQLRKENGKLFTGRKYSAQAGWELILQQMRQEFPSIMADVHYRVLKKKWSNLLQQYKELKNPVHGDKNRADDVSWPFYGAIDEVLECSGGGGGGRRTPGSTSSSYVDYIDPHEFLCVSVNPDDEAGDATTTFEEFPTDGREDERNDEQEVTFSRGSATPRKGRQNSKDVSVGSTPAIELERILRGDQTTNRAPRSHLPARRKRNSRNLSSGMPRLPGGTEISIEKITTRSIFGKDPPAKSRIRNDLVVCSSSTSAVTPATTTAKRNENQTTLTNVTTSSATWTTSVSASVNAKRTEVGAGDEERPKKSRRTRGASSSSWCQEDREARIERRLEQFFQYARRRDEENRSIMMRILCAVETIANKL